MPCMFEDMAYAFGAEYGVDRKDMNINGQFLRILPGNDMELQETVIIAAVGTGAAVIAAEMITVLISVRRPAKTASSVSPVEAAKYSGYDVCAEKKRGKNAQEEQQRSIRKTGQEDHSGESGNDEQRKKPEEVGSDPAFARGRRCSVYDCSGLCIFHQS